MTVPKLDYEKEAAKLLKHAGHAFIDKHEAAKVLGHAGIYTSAFRRKFDKMLQLGLIEKGKSGNTIRVTKCIV